MLTKMDGLHQKNSKKRWNRVKAILRKLIVVLNNGNLTVTFHCLIFLNLKLIESREEINFLLMCCDTNHDGKIDYIEFTERFHNPAKDIGFNLAVLLTNLSEHMPNEPRFVKYFLNEFIRIKFI